MPCKEFEWHFQQANICTTEFKTVPFHFGLQSLSQQNPIPLSLNKVLPHQVVVSNGFSAGTGLQMKSNQDHSLSFLQVFPFRGVIAVFSVSALLRLFPNSTSRY